MKTLIRNIIIFALGIMTSLFANTTDESPNLRFEISFTKSAHAKPITGRVYVMISDNSTREPRLQMRRTGSPFFGEDIENLKPGQTAVINKNTFGSPVEYLAELEAGDYYVQGFVNIYSEFKRADGHTLWMHDDQWEGQSFNRSPGNIYSDVVKVHLDPEKGYNVKLDCGNVIPPIEVPPETKWVKRIKFQSDILTKFWGRPIYLGATVVLPKGYDDHPDIYYPVDYVQGHFTLRPPYGFTTEPPDSDSRRARQGYELYQAWISDNYPRMILVTFQHPCPYFDDSYAVNSANCGPYGDAIMEELIPKIETRFRIIRESYARILEGGSTGGWEALALQIFYPDFFGGAFSYCPDPVDFHDVEGINVYEGENAYTTTRGWVTVPNIAARYADGSIQMATKQKNDYERVRGTKGRSGEQFDIWSAVHGPVGEDGYFKPLWNKVTGEMDSSVARYWIENYDLRYYLEKNWTEVAPKLVDKLHIFTGDMDTFYLNNATHLLEDFMKTSENPHYEGFFWYGPRKPHCWAGPWTPAERLKYFAVHIARHAPRNVETLWWKF